MINRNLSRQLSKINHLFSETGSATSENMEMQAHWAKYLCVICAGFIENALQELFTDFVKSRGAPELVAYISKRLQKVRNPKGGRVVEVANQFSIGEKISINEYLEEGGRGDSIDTIMNNRHKIAHGQDSNITISRLSLSFDKSVEVIEYIEEKLN